MSQYPIDPAQKPPTAPKADPVERPRDPTYSPERPEVDDDDDKTEPGQEDPETRS